MSEARYRAAVEVLRETLDMLGPYRGPCGLCGDPDARHRQADAIAGAILAGEAPEAVADDYVTGGASPAAVTVVHTVTIAVLAADPHRHRITRGRAAGIDREVWAGLTAATTEE